MDDKATEIMINLSKQLCLHLKNEQERYDVMKSDIQMKEISLETHDRIYEDRLEKQRDEISVMLSNLKSIFKQDRNLLINLLNDIEVRYHL